MRLFHHYSDLLSLLQCQSTTNVTIVVPMHINFVKKMKFGAEKTRQIIVKTASDVEIPRPRENRGSNCIMGGPYDSDL